MNKYVAIIGSLFLLSFKANGDTLFCIDTIEDKPDCISLGENKWFGSHLSSMDEKSLYNQYDSSNEFYRFTLLPTFNHPEVFKVILKHGYSGKIIVKMNDGKGGYNPGKLVKNDTFDLNKKEIKSICKILDTISFWNMKTHEKEIIGPNGEHFMIFDGAKWLLEGNKYGKYHLVIRQSPEVKRQSPEISKFRLFCETLMKIANNKVQKSKARAKKEEG